MLVVPLYVNVVSGTAHADRECEFLARVPDSRVRLAHCQTSGLPPMRLCRRCIPLRIDFSLLEPIEIDDLAAVVNAA